MVDFIYKLQKKVDNLRKPKISITSWYILKYLLNFFLPCYYKLVPFSNYIRRSEILDKEVIVSLTSFPKRMETLPIVLETLYRQSVQVDKIILWLGESQFPSQQEKLEVESILSKYIKKGLNVRYCEDIRAHKKYFYTMIENPNSIIITVDDDVLYPSDTIFKLLSKHLEFPNAIVGNRGHLILLGQNRELVSYNNWKHNLNSDEYRIPNQNIFLTGCAGVLYPPNILSNHVFDLDILKEKCLYADDIWLKCMEKINNIPSVLTEDNIREVFDLRETAQSGLANINVKENMNDVQIKNVSEYYNIKWW